MLFKNSVSCTHSATVEIWLQNRLKWPIWKIFKMRFRGQIWVRVKFKHNNGFETKNSIYPENLGLLDMFLSKKVQLKNLAPYSLGWLYIIDNFFSEFLLKMDLIKIIYKSSDILFIWGDLIAYSIWLCYFPELIRFI